MNKLYIFTITCLLTPQLYAHGISEADKQRMLDGGLLEYVGLGATHMLTGYDHLLFLFGVIFFLTKFKEIVKFITVFTLGHSITLIFATFMGISANYFLIDAIIALTVIYKGFDNIDGFKKYLNCRAPNLLILVFVFGLIHGFGLSTRLQQLPLGEEGLLLKIISFNGGVELGQVVALSVMLVLLSGWRKRASFDRFSRAANGGLMILGTLLFLMQMHGYSHVSFVDELAFSQKKHREDHQSMDTLALNHVSVGENNEWTDTIVIKIPAGKSLEYKFSISEGEVLKYSWTTSEGELFFDFHGDPKGGGQFVSFEKSTKSKSSGSLKIPFEGSHGWYWSNKNSNLVEVTLKTKGSYKIIGIL